MRSKRSLLLLPLLWVLACAPEPEEAIDELPPTGFEEELAIGAIDDLKTDGDWGAALQCKAIPDLEPLAAPTIVVSLDGLTLHLTDAETGYDRVFPIGPGSIKDGESLTPLSTGLADGLFHIRLDKPVGAESSDPGYAPWAYAYSCRMWWKDPDTGTKVPVFAGLPFLRLEGAPTLGYAIHGPIDSYTIPSGGRLRRGYVSHGCIRMEAADVLELYALTLGHKVPVRVQQAVERRADGSAVDLPQKWLLAECATDEECTFDGGFCHANPYTGKGYCTRECLKYCPDEYGQPVSFCVADPEDDAKGLCTLKAASFNNHCRRYPGFELAQGIGRFGQPSVTADVCLPGSQGWVGDSCFTDLDCGLAEGSCILPASGDGAPGFCSLPCTKYCPDLESYDGTFCVTGADGAGQCVEKCTGQDDCPTGMTCTEETPRHNDPATAADVCLP
jgi:hypothetical protein